MTVRMTQKVSELLKVLIFLVFSCMVIFVLGLLTRPSSTTHYIYISKEREVEPMSSKWKHEIASAMSELNELKAKLKELEDLENKEAPQPTMVEVIDSYIYEITSERYPAVDPELIRAIVYSESRYIPDKINSRTGVQGLCQINPKWHMSRALSLGVTDLLDPYGNILVCCDLLNELYEDYPKDYALDLYAGGYPYANSYAGAKSPHTILIDDTIAGLRDGRIVPGQ